MAWSVLQSAVAPCAFGTAIEANPATFGSNCSAGTVLLAFVQVNTNNVGSVSTVKDGAGNSFTKIYEFQTVNAVIASVWAMVTPAGDVGIKPAITATTSNPNAWAGGILIQEVSGIQAVADGSPASVAGTASPTGSPSYSTTAASEYLVAYYADNSTSSSTVTWTAPGGYSTDAHSVNGSTTGGNQAVCYKNSTNGAEAGSFTWTTTGTDNTVVVLAAFQLAPVVVAGRSLIVPQAVKRAAFY